MKIILNKKLTCNQLVDFAFILFFCSGLIRKILAPVLGEGDIAKIVAVIIIYMPLLLVVILNPEKYIKMDAICLPVFIGLFFLVTLFWHPEYEYFYTRETYGVWSYVMIPYKGIYAYLYIRLMDTPERLERNLRISGWLMFIDFTYQLYRALNRGFWYGVSFSEANAEMSYSVSFGYEVLLFALIFLYAALKYRRKSDIIASVISITMILIGGSRGSVLFIAIFLLLYIVKEISETKHKLALICLLTTGFGALYLVYKPLLLFASKFISRMGFSSRFINSFINGTITADSGRNIIWDVAVKMIKDNPFGYGAMGSRFKLTSLVDPGYPHSLILEVLIDYGIFIGTILLIIYFVKVISLVMGETEWSGVALPVFCTSCCLFLSLTYWNYPAFWMKIGLTVNNAIKTKR